MPTELFFDLPAVLRLAEHAHSAADHIPSITEQDNGQTCPGALEWVADTGVYLMSGGLPALLTNPEDPHSSNVVVYAEGWGPDTARRMRAATDIGGDDFVEHLHLQEPFGPKEMPLIEVLRVGAACGFPYLVLHLDGDTIATRLSGNGPDGGQ